MGRIVQRVGDICFEVCKNTLDDCISVPEGKICQEILELYNKKELLLNLRVPLRLLHFQFMKKT